jgi:2-polyprenyl-3-methyl-5-hydroxy-6-metoxy-1,4-benzoquinol methylase
VVATDATDHCQAKMAALRHYYGTEFSFQKVGLMYDLAHKLRKAGNAGFDVINLSGLLYHVFSPLMVLAGVRPLLKKQGLMIVSTNVVKTRASPCTSITVAACRARQIPSGTSRSARSTTS